MISLTRRIPFAHPDLNDDDVKAVLTVLRANNLGGHIDDIEFTLNQLEQVLRQWA